MKFHSISSKSLLKAASLAPDIASNAERVSDAEEVREIQRRVRERLPSLVLVCLRGWQVEK